jgi:hypothetical protein
MKYYRNKLQDFGVLPDSYGLSAFSLVMQRVMGLFLRFFNLLKPPASAGGGILWGDVYKRKEIIETDLQSSNGH